VINDQASLSSLAAELHPAPRVCLDTEADSLHAYPEKLCLLQINYNESNVLVDPLAGLDLAPLWQAIASKTLILHGADYDLRLLKRNHDFIPAAIFDTMLAARLLGEMEFGLNNLLTKFLGIELEKGSQKADWGRRPLTPKMESYAINDAKYLQQLSSILAAKLEEKGRLAWHLESCSRLIQDCSKISALPRESWRIKGSNRLGRRALGVLQEVWKWRERHAVAANKPPYFILNHEALIDIAAAAGTGRPYLEFLPKTFRPQRKDEIIECVNIALKVPPNELPSAFEPDVHQTSERERKLFEQLKQRRDAQALELTMDPTIIASKNTLLQLAQSESRGEGVLMDWQKLLIFGTL
jgi:ribonuclease D